MGGASNWLGGGGGTGESGTSFSGNVNWNYFDAQNRYTNWRGASVAFNDDPPVDLNQEAISEIQNKGTYAAGYMLIRVPGGFSIVGYWVKGERDHYFGMHIYSDIFLVGLNGEDPVEIAGKGKAGGGLNTANNIASGVGVAGTGLGLIDGTFRLAKSGKFSLGYYSSGWSTGNQYVKNLYSVSKVGKGLSTGASVITTGIAYNEIINGAPQPITYVDAGVGTMGVIASGATYFYGVQIPIVGEFVAVYGALRVSWDVGFYLGQQYGPSTWYGKNDYKWFE